MIRREYVIRIVEGTPGGQGFSDLHSRRLWPWELGYKLAKLRDAFFVILRSEVSHTRDLVMRERAPERLAVDDLTHRAFDEVWSAQTHERRAFDHDDEVR